MAKLHIITLNQDIEFSGGRLTAGTVLGNFDSEVGMDPTQVFNMLQYRQASIEVVDYEPEAILDSLPMSLSNDEGEEGDEDELGDSQPAVSTVSVAAQEVVKVEEVKKSDLYSIPMSESTVEALIAGGIPDLKALIEYIQSGKDLVDLPKIGPAKVKNILDAVKSSGIMDTLAAADGPSISAETIEAGETEASGASVV